MGKLRGLLDSANETISGLLGDFPEGFNRGALAGVAGWPGDMAYMADTARRALSGERTGPAAQDFPGTTDYIAAQAGYPIPQSFSGQLGSMLGGMLSPSPTDLARLTPLLAAIPFWHGSPHKYDAVDLSKIGTGEGAQAYGHGYYGADAKSTAESYKSDLRDAKVNDPRDLAESLFNVMAKDSPYGDKVAAGPNRSLYTKEKFINSVLDGTLDTSTFSPRMVQTAEDALKADASLYRGEYRWPDPAKEAATPLTGEDLLDWDRPLSEQPGLKAYLSQSLSNVGAGNANNSGALSKGGSAPAEISSNRDIPLNSVVGNRMSGMLDNGKVGNSVVGFVPVDVVDALAGKQLSSDVGLHNQPVDLALPSVNGGNGVSLGVNSSASPVGGVALPPLAEGARVGGDVIGVPVNTLSAIRAGDFDKSTGHDLYRAISDELGSDKAASDYLTSRNVLGIRYLDQMSRGAGEGTRNYVFFDQDGIALLERNGEPLKAAEDFAARRAGKAKPYKQSTGAQ